ncbi:hypothetical protein [Thermus sp. NEB1569]|uniref:hypothetical protein n=1 Tax=Thermus sp. NEB1569 TaxID=2918899 RepID=UPI001EFA5E67|nr:hypothetical protein [Thermus sp. NEB1569]ULR40450.1 hypothetical protein MI302_10130 [Thermus sp. NEB1569]
MARRKTTLYLEEEVLRAAKVRAASLGVTTPRTKVRGFSGFPPKAPSGPRKTLTPYRQASAMLLALPRVFVWSFTHRTTRWNPLLQVSRSTGNFAPKNIVPNPCPPVVDVGEQTRLDRYTA